MGSGIQCFLICSCSEWSKCRFRIIKFYTWFTFIDFASSSSRPKHSVFSEVMSEQVTVGKLCLRANAGKHRNALKLVLQASDTITTSMRIMRQFVPAHIVGIKPLRLTQSPSYYFSLGHWNCYQVMCLHHMCVHYMINHETQWNYHESGAGKSPWKKKALYSVKSPTALL